MDFREIAVAAATGVVAMAAAGRCGLAARRSRGAARMAWAWLAAGAALAAAGEAAYALGQWQSADLAAAPPAQYAAWASLYYFVFISYAAAAALRPHVRPAAPVRAARTVDTLLLSLLLLTGHFYFAVSYRLSADTWGRRLAGALLVLAVSAAAAGWLARHRRAADSRRWQRVYGRLAVASLLHGAGEAIYLLLRGPQGAIEPSWQAWCQVANGLQISAFACLALAARPSEKLSDQAPSPETVVLPIWRELLGPSVVFAGLLALPLADRLFAPAPDSPIHAWTLAAALNLYVLLMLSRQFLAQQENRALSRDLHHESIRLRLLVDNINDAVLTEDLAGRIVFANDRFLELFDLRREEAVGRRLEEFLHPEDLSVRSGRAENRLLDSLLPVRFEFRGLRRDGGVLHLESSLVPVRVSGAVLGFQSVIRDITERRRAEERQRELVQRLEFFVNNMPLGCIVFDLDFGITEWNQSATRIFGWTAAEACGRHGLELLVPRELWTSVVGVWDELQETKSANRRQYCNLTQDRGPIECEWFNTSLVDQDGRVVGVASMVQDVTERKSLEEQLRQSQKMEAVGVLAGGIAHDFNNLLTIIVGNLSLALLRLGEEHPAGRGLRDAERAGERAAELVRQLLGFSRKSRSQPRPLSLNTCLEETLALLRTTIDPRVSLELNREPALWPVEADPGQIHQVLVNLCVNARDAMPEGGRLIITTANRTLDDRYCRRHPESRPGDFVALSIADTGQGMDPATVARIFEPFFTTKELGKGTGLGLAMVYGIVQQHGGWITVDSMPGEGSTFTVLLPRTRAALPVETPEPAGTRAAGGPETVLLVDDEVMILNLARAILEANGHHVIEAHDGEEALDLFRLRRERIDLVLMDMLMPRKSGRDTLEELHRLAPEVPVVLASGYALVASDELAALGARAYIQKPYRPSELARTVRQALDSAATARRGDAGE